MASLNPATQVFAIPELVALIVLEWQTIHQASGGASLGLIARNWLIPVIAQEWESEANLRRLRRLSQDRRQFYADHIRRLNISKLRRLGGLLPNLSLPRLERLYLGRLGRRSDMQTPLDTWTSVLLGPKLRELHLVSKSLLTPELAIRIPQRCPSLKILSIHDLPKTSDSVKIVDKLASSLPQLASLRLPQLFWSLSEQITSTMRALWNLEELCDLQFIDAIIPELTSTGLRFEHLTSLNCKASFATLKCLAEAMPSLTCLKLVLTPPSLSEPDPPLITPLCPLSRLEDLDLSVEGEFRLEPTDFAVLCHFSQLHRLCIGSADLRVDRESESDRGSIGCPNLTETDFKAVFEQLPSLITLDLRLRINQLGILALFYVAAFCRKLRTLNMEGIHALESFSQYPSYSPRPAFPSLVEWTSGRIGQNYTRRNSRTTHEELGRMIDVLREHFPRIEKVHVRRDSYLSRRIRTVICYGWDILADPLLNHAIELPTLEVPAAEETDSLSDDTISESDSEEGMGS